MFRLISMFLFLGWLGVVSFACSRPPTTSKGCTRDLDCPSNTFCRTIRVQGKPFGVCIKEVPKFGLNTTCKVDTDCVSVFCFQPGKESPYCTKNCKTTADCTTGMICKVVGTGLQICVREDVISLPKKGCECGKEGASCSRFGHSDCDTKQGYFCLSTKPNDINARCVKPCIIKTKPGQKSGCSEGFVCSPTQNGINICTRSPFTAGGMASNCAKAGAAQCTSQLFCYSRFPNDPEAFCSRSCSPYREGDCGKGFVCESPREQDPYLCVPRGKLSIGEDCSKRLFLDCKGGACVSLTRRGQNLFCTQRCDPSEDKCPAGYKCELFGHLYRYFCRKTSGGSLGALCNKLGAADCKSKICVLPKAGSINKICSQSCDAKAPCPGGWECDRQQKACVPKTGNKKIGDACSKTEECINGTCVSNSAGKQFCSQVCTDSKQCPDKFECRYLGFTQRYCLPKLAGTGKVGAPCPNGPGDCADGSCLTDIVNGKTFCTKRCNSPHPPSPPKPPVKCPSPFVCKDVGGNRSYCTPKGYTPP